MGWDGMGGDGTGRDGMGWVGMGWVGLIQLNNYLLVGITKFGSSSALASNS